MTGEFSMYHWLVVLAIVLLFFGPSKLPQFGQSLGKAIRGFKDSLNSGVNDGEVSKAVEVKDDKHPIA